MITVFYDGKCGLCSKEINYYKKIAPPNVFDWQDITQSSEKLTSAGITLEEGLKNLHAMDNNGQFHVGVEAFVLIWQQLDRWRTLAFFISLPMIHQTAKVAYKIFATWRFKRLSHCQILDK